MTTTQAVDRPAAIRRALRDLVAEHGFHGASMSAVAKAAGVATGTAYVHYASKEDLVHATYLEIKRDLSAAVLSTLDRDVEPKARYSHIWRATYLHLLEQPERAGFLTQLEESPYFESAYRMLQEQGDPIVEEATREDLLSLLIPLPMEVLYSLSLGAAVRLVSSGATLTDEEIETLIAASWRAITMG